MKLEDLYALETLDELRVALQAESPARLRKQLSKAFLKLCRYTNAEEWNHAVRLCEALSIVGWGELEPVQAIRGVYFNGSPETQFKNRFAEPRFVSAIWSKRKAGLTMEPGQSWFYSSPDLPGETLEECEDFEVTERVLDVPLATQRNWIPKSPIWIYRSIDNAYDGSRKLIEGVEQKLRSALTSGMSSDRYGTAIDMIGLKCSFSYQLPGCQDCNYVLLEEDVRLSPADLHKRLRKIYSAKEIKENGYYLRKRIDFGTFRAAKGQMTIELHFTREFSQQSLQKQKQEFAQYLTDAVGGAVVRLKKKKLDYDLDQMQEDFERILQAWVG